MSADIFQIRRNTKFEVHRSTGMVPITPILPSPTPTNTPTPTTTSTPTPTITNTGTSTQTPTNTPTKHR